MKLPPTPLPQTPQGHLPLFITSPTSYPHLITFVLVTFTLSPFFSKAHFQILILASKSFSESANITRSSAYSSSQGSPSLCSLDSASSTMIKSKGPNTDTLCMPTLTSNHYSLLLTT